MEGYDIETILDDANINCWRGLWVNASTPRLSGMYLKQPAGKPIYSASDKAYYEKMRQLHPGMEWPS
jgi:hypothetical protein